MMSVLTIIKPGRAILFVEDIMQEESKCLCVKHVIGGLWRP